MVTSWVLIFWLVTGYGTPHVGSVTDRALHFKTEKACMVALSQIKGTHKNWQGVCIKGAL